MNAVYRQLVANGITGIRDPGSQIPLDTLGLWKREIADGRRVGPRLIVTGPSIEQASGDCSREHALVPSCESVHVYIDRPEQAPYLVDSIKAAGADMIKIHKVSRPIWFAIAAEARRVGIPVGGHFARDSADGFPSTVDGLVASDSGAAILDHELWADVCRQENDTIRSQAECNAAAARLRRNRTWMVGGIGGARLPDSLLYRALRYGNAEGARTLSFGGPSAAPDSGPWRPPTATERSRLPTGTQLAAVISDSARQGAGCQQARMAHAADLPWLPGLDFPIGPVLGTHLALLYPALCGVPPLWLLRAATLGPAQALGLSDSLGAVAAGKVADLVLLDDDPLEDIWNVTKIEAVVANGRYLDRVTLGRLLTEAGEEWFKVVAAQRQAEDKRQENVP